MSRPLKIALIAACPFPCPRGTPIRIQRMADALAEFGHEVHVITYHIGDKNGNHSFQIHRISNISFYQNTKPGPTFLKLFFLDILLSIKIIRLHAELDFDIIHAHHYEGLLATLPSKLFFSTPILYDAHTLLSTELHYYKIPIPPQILDQIAAILDRTLPKFADHVVSVSKSIAEKLIVLKSDWDEWVSVIPNGVDVDLFLQQEIEKPMSDGLILAYAGNFAPYQRLDVLLEAFLYVHESYPNVKLMIFTEDDPTGVLVLINEMDLEAVVHVLKTSFSDLPDKLAETDILLNPRMDGAGHPLKLLNYMAAKKSIVTFSGSAHGLVHNQTAWIVEENSAKSFAEGILTLIQDPKKRVRIGRNARQYVEVNHVWDVNASMLTEIYLRLLSK